LLLRTTLAMRELHEPHAWWRFARHPFDAGGALWRIHWQALRLALKRVPFHGAKPARRVPRAAIAVDAAHHRRTVDTQPSTSPRDDRP
jgi:DUF1365 family protein